jgi:hypothetical protein
MLRVARALEVRTFGNETSDRRSRFFHDPKVVSHAGAVGQPNRLRLCNQTYVEFRRCQIEKFRKSSLVRESFSNVARNHRSHRYFATGKTSYEICRTMLAVVKQKAPAESYSSLGSSFYAVRSSYG